VHHIRALWHRNLSWEYKPGPNDKLVAGVDQPFFRDGWFNPILQEDYDALKDKVQKYGYDSVEQLIRWRTYKSTGGGLMAELGSHQLDACSIFLGKVHPLAVSGVGTKCLFGPKKNDRDIDDHVFVTYEFPGKNYPADKNDVVVVTYSSISTNRYDEYGEVVMGTRGRMVVEQEKSLMLFPEAAPGGASVPKPLQVSVGATGGGKPAVDTAASWGGSGPPPAGTAATGPAGTDNAPVSRGYREEMEDFAYCIRRWDAKEGYEKDGNGKYKQRLPRCHGEVAMADAIVALTANQAMRDHKRIEFKNAWFDSGDSQVPDDPDAKPKVGVI
jgi:predicted dehydrogenase